MPRKEDGLKRWMAVVAACTLAACGSGTSTTRPTQAPEEPAAVVAPVPTVDRPADQPAEPGKGYDVWFNSVGVYQVINRTDQPQFYCVAAFGVWPDGNQGAFTAVYENAGIFRPGDYIDGQVKLFETDCHYRWVQVDATQSEHCARFDWNNVLGAKVYDNPNYGHCVIPEPQPTPTPQPSPSPTPGPEPTPTPAPSPTPTPEAPSYCYYEITGQPAGKAALCLAANGLWQGWYTPSPGGDHEQCRLAFPGFSDSHFNLNSAKSATSCLKKPTGNQN